MVTIYTGLSI